MKYICNYCNYETDRKSNYDKHIASITHMDNINIIEDNYCDMCGNKYLSRKSLLHHQKTCVKQKEIINNVVDKVKNELNNTIIQLKTELINKDTAILEKEKELIKLSEHNNCLMQLIDEKDKIIVVKDKMIESQQKENEFNKKMLASTTSFITPKRTTINYIMINFTTAPKLQIKPIRELMEKSDEEVIQDMIYFQRHKKLSRYFSNAIIKEYRKQDPKDQALWNTDSSRSNYVLREDENDILVWKYDKKGVAVKERIIKPIIVYINELFDIGNANIEEELKKAINNKNYTRRDKLNDDRALLYDIYKEKDELENKLMREIAPYLNIDRDGNIKVIDMDDILNDDIKIETNDKVNDVINIGNVGNDENYKDNKYNYDEDEDDDYDGSSIIMPKAIIRKDPKKKGQYMEYVNNIINNLSSDEDDD